MGIRDTDTWEYFTSWWLIPRHVGLLFANLLLYLLQIGPDVVVQGSLRLLVFAGVIIAIINDRRPGNTARRRMFGPPRKRR